MRVRALKRGQKNDYRWAEEGDEFDHDGPLATWMEPLDAQEEPDGPKGEVQAPEAQEDAAPAQAAVLTPAPKRKPGRPKKASA